jgi:hypothetical protein
VSFGGKGVKSCSTMTQKKKKTTVRVAKDFFEKDAKVT